MANKNNREYIPPQAVDIEEMILSTVMIDQEAMDVLMETLATGDFYKPVHQKAFGAMQNIYSRGDRVDMFTLQEELEKAGEDNAEVVASTIATTDRIGVSIMMDRYCEIIKEKSMRRQMIKGCHEIISRCYDTTQDTLEVIDKAQETVFAVTESRGKYHMQSIGETMTQVMAEVNARQEQGEPIGLKTGLSDIDSTLQGFQKSKLYVIGARPSMGKTSLVMTIMRNFARNGHGSGLLSLETSHEAIGVRLIAQVSGLPAERIISGKMTDEELELFFNASSELASLNIHTDDEPAITGQKVRAKCRLMMKKGVDVIFVDFLQLMVAEGRSKHEEVGSLTKTLKAVSKELNIPIVVLSQLSRKVENRQDKRPQMADLRESGSIEEDADVIIFLYRPEYYGITTTTEGRSSDGLCEVFIAKNKDGKTGVQSLRFLEESMRFENYTHNRQYQEANF